MEIDLFEDVREMARLDVAHRRVLVRTDLDVSVSPHGWVTDDRALRLALPTIRGLTQQGCRVLLASTFGTAAAPLPATHIGPIALRLSELLGTQVHRSPRNLRAALSVMTEGQVAILPNLFDFPEDVNNDPGFAREIARSIDVYVNDSMRLCAQKTATIDALPRLMPSRGTGLALAKELDALTKMRVGPEAKFFLVVGGDRLMDKAAMIRALLPHADALVLGGVPANTVLGALGWTIGPQNVDASAVQFAHELIQLTAERELLVLPKDFVVRDPTTRAGRTIDLASMTPTDTIVDLGTETQLSYRDTLVRAHSVLWSGTMGNCNDDSTHEGTRAIGTHLTEGTVFSVITERKLVTAVEYLGLSSNYTLLSEGDAATLAFLSGERLTGLEALREP